MNDVLFEIETPLGFDVRLTRARWDLIVTEKHPVMFGCEEDVEPRWRRRMKFEGVDAILP